MVEDRDLGYAKLMRQLVNFKSPSVTVGLHGDVKDYDDGTSVATIGNAHEYGIGVPMRSFLRSTFDENERKYLRMTEKGITKAIDGNGTVAGALDLVGVVAKGDVQEKIVDIREPPNSKLTVALKGSSNPLIDTGHMRQSIDFKVTI